MSLDVIYDLIHAALPSSTVMRARQSGEVPAADLVTFRELDSDHTRAIDVSDGALYSDEPGEGEPSPTPDVGTFDRTQKRIVPTVIQVDVYGPRDDVDTLLLFAASESGREILHLAGWGFVDAGTVRDLSGLGDTEWLPRWSVDVRFVRQAQRVEARPAILSIRATGTIGGVATSLNWDEPAPGP